jgi:DNA primase
MDADGILERIDLVEYIGQYVDLEEDNGEWMGLCPFHPDLNPSFSVTADENLFFCFGCGKGGNAISFVMHYHHVNYDDALKILCGHLGIDGSEMPPRLEATKTLRQFSRKPKRKKVATYKILDPNYMARYELNWDKLKVWEDEGISRETMQKFQVRYCPFDNRIVFPIRTVTGEIMSVSGRTLDPDYKTKLVNGKKIRKYTYFQDLGEIDTLYGLSDNLTSIKEKREVIIFEGAKSVMKADSWGIYNSAAALTSHLSEPQVKILVKLGVRVVLALDAGVNVNKDKHLPMLKRFVPVETIVNYQNLLEEKMSPADAGIETWRTLYERRKRLN